MTLGPLLFVEFCALSKEIQFTSIAMENSSSQLTSNCEISLAQLSMRAFASCIRGMACNAPQHTMSPAKRVSFLLSSAIARASAAVPSSKDGWDSYRKLDTGDAIALVSDDELQLGKALLPFLSLATRLQPSESRQSNKMQLCLFSELLYNGMYGEAMDCCHMIFSAAEAFTEPNMKEQVGVFILRAWEYDPSPGGEDSYEPLGVLGLKHQEDGVNGNFQTTSSAVRMAMKLNCGLDGNTSVPLAFSEGNDDLRASRSKMGLPTTAVENWPDKHQGRLGKERVSTSGTIGIGTQLSWAFSATL